MHEAGHSGSSRLLRTLHALVDVACIRGVTLLPVHLGIASRTACACDSTRWRVECGIADLRRLTAFIEREESGHSALCPEYDIAGQGATISEVRDNLVEAPSLFVERAGPPEVERRFHRRW